MPSRQREDIPAADRALARRGGLCSSGIEAMRHITLLAAAAGLALALPASSAAAPPPNDNYLASLTINRADGALATEFTDAVDTTEAGTQADVFDPNRDGVPLGGGPPEPTSCPAGTPLARTVWWDFSPPVPGGVQITATGIDTVIAVHEWNPETSLITRTLACQNADPAPAETVLLRRRLEAGARYTIQVGDPGTGGGPVELRFRYFPDTDGDGTLDEEPDKCLELAGIRAFGGCPPVVRGGPRILFDRLATGIRVASLFVDRVARGSRIAVRCRRCGAGIERTARRRGTLRLDGFSGRTVAAGDRITVRIRHPRARSGRYRFGAIGKDFTWPVVAGGLGPRTERCVAPGSGKRMRCP